MGIRYSILEIHNEPTHRHQPQRSCYLPDCSHEFPLSRVFHHLIECYEAEYDQKLSEEREALEARALRKAERQLATRFEDQLGELSEKLEEARKIATKSQGS